MRDRLFLMCQMDVIVSSCKNMNLWYFQNIEYGCDEHKRMCIYTVSYSLKWYETIIYESLHIADKVSNLWSKHIIDDLNIWYRIKYYIALMVQWKWNFHLEMSTKL